MIRGTHFFMEIKETSFPTFYSLKMFSADVLQMKRRRRRKLDDKKCLQIISPHGLIRKNYINCFNKNFRNIKKPDPEFLAIHHDKIKWQSKSYFAILAFYFRFPIYGFSFLTISKEQIVAKFMMLQSYYVDIDYRRFSKFADFLSANSLIHIAKICPKR